MTSTVQTLLALAIVALAAAGLLWRALAKKKNPGCGGDCGCATNELKSRLKPGRASDGVTAAPDGKA